MTNSYDVDHGLSQCPPGPLEPVEISDCAAPGVSTVEDERRPDACPRCDGSGHISVPSDNSPDAREVDVCCDHCQGTGAAVDAAKYLAAALSGEKYRHMQIYGEFKNFHRSLCARFGYAHDDIHFRRDLVSLEEAIAAKVAAPAAGDALGVVTLVTRQGRGQELFTYTSQPCDNVIAWRIGEACSKASHASAGDYIDRGLSLLKELQRKGYGIADISAAQRKGDA